MTLKGENTTRYFIYRIPILIHKAMALVLKIYIHKYCILVQCTYKWCMSIIIKTWERENEEAAGALTWIVQRQQFPMVKHQQKYAIKSYNMTHSRTFEHTHTRNFFVRSNFRQINKIYSCGNMVCLHKMPWWNVYWVLARTCVRMVCKTLRKNAPTFSRIKTITKQQ